jgi:hypothetical protein
MIGNGVLVLQNCTDVPSDARGSDTEIRHDGNEVIYIKTEDVTDIQEEEEPLLEAFPLIEVKQEVSFHVCVYIIRPVLRCL